MPTEVLYRKWRPRSFAEVAGQEGVVRTLTNAVGSGKVAHAYLFSGPRGTGKTTTGRLLAKALNCTQPKDGEPCNSCESCQSYNEGRALDLIELDAASNRGIDEIRNLREKANYAPAAGGDARKVYLVDEVHMLTDAAFNALLKTLEEPPPHVVFALATTEAHKLPATVVSRCQRFDFKRIPLAAVVERLAYIAGQEGIECPQDGLETIARTATGSLRDAINLLEQLVDSYGANLTVEQVREGLGLVIDARTGELAAHVLREELAEGLALINAVRDDGLDLRQFQRQVVAHLRGLLLVKAGAPPADMWSAEQLDEMRALVADVPAERIIGALHAFGEADLRADPLSPLPLELAIATSILKTNAPAAAPPPARAPAPARAQPKASLPPRPAPQSPPRAAPTPTPPSDPVAFARTPEPAPAVPPQSTPSPAPRAPAAPIAPIASNGASGVDEIRERWPDIYKRARDLHFRVGALLNSGCGIIDATDDALVFGFRHEMHLDRMQSDGGENLRALQQAVDDVIGPGRTVRCIHDPDVVVQQPNRGGHLVRAAEELGAQVLPNEE